MSLANENCKPLKTGDMPLSAEEAKRMAGEIPTWILEENEIHKESRFKDFREAMGFVNKVASISNEEDHHPDIFISYNKVRLTFSTHKIGGLSRNDFIMAAKTDRL